MNKGYGKSHLAIALVGLTLVFVAALFQLVRVEQNVTAQTCAPITLLSTNAAWYQGTSSTPTVVSVYIKPSRSWSEAQVNAIKAAVTNWESAQSQTGCNCFVDFEFTKFENVGTYRLKIERYTPQDSALRGQLESYALSQYSNQPGRFYINKATIIINPSVTNELALTKVTAHEIGHTFGLGHCPQGQCIDSSTVMAYYDLALGINETTTGLTTPNACDQSKIRTNYCPTPSPTPTPTPTPTPPSSCPFSIVPSLGGECPNGYYPDTNGSPYCCPNRGWCNGLPDWNQFPGTGCAQGFVLNGNGYCTRSSAFAAQCFGGGYDPESCACVGGCEDGACSPVVIDTNGNGFVLTNALNGVNFDVDGDGVAERRAWTTANSDEAWLVFDRNRNGTIDDGKELFGSVTPQPPPQAGMEYNGFNALGMYDEQGFGGNGDGWISRQDAIFSSLRLWQDANHNGVSEASELKTLPSVGLARIDLDYRRSRRVDEHGNEFKYRTKVRDAQGAQLGRWAWDVFLVGEP